MISLTTSQVLLAANANSDGKKGYGIKQLHYRGLSLGGFCVLSLRKLIQLVHLSHAL